MMNGVRVVVTGTGMITSLGHTTRDTWEGLKAGRSGIRRIQAFDPTGSPSQVASEVVDFKPEQYLDRKEARRMSRFVQLAMVAAKEAMQDSGLIITEANRDQVGVLVGTAIGGLEQMEEAHTTLVTRGASRVSPFTVPMMIGDMAAGQISIAVGARGPNFSIASACASGAHAIGEAYETIRRGDAVAMLAGASESAITPLALAAFCAVRAVTTASVPPDQASRPFDRNRDGFVMGEGAGIVVLEELEAARRRGARILAEVIGYAATADASHITAPDPVGAGAAEAMRRALVKAHVTPVDVSYINAHGTATQLGDVAETLEALLQLDGHHVELVANGALALEKLHSQTYDLILSDVRMPDTDGPRLYTQLERQHPELLRRVAFLTGDTLSAETREFLERTRVPTMAKPFTLEQVRQVLQQVTQKH